MRDYASTQKNVTYIDVFTPMLGANGQPQPKWFVEDRQHMNRTGYELWIMLLKPWMDVYGR